MSSFALLAAVALLASLLMLAGWCWQVRRHNAGIVDVLWATALALSALLLAILGPGAIEARVALALLGGLWGGRLAWHLWQRVRSEPEDGRYQHLRTHWNGSQWRFFLFFQFQAGLVVLFALPMLAVAVNPHPSIPNLVAALMVSLVAIIGETVADKQLAAFRGNPAHRGRTCRQGLWRYSRHPNYFFEWLHWFAYVVLAIGSPLFWLSWLGPVIMYVFLRWVSGIPFTEAQSLRSRGDDYRDYQRTTPMLFPWFPKPSALPSTPQGSTHEHD